MYRHWDMSNSTLSSRGRPFIIEPYCICPIRTAQPVVASFMQQYNPSNNNNEDGGGTSLDEAIFKFAGGSRSLVGWLQRVR